MTSVEKQQCHEVSSPLSPTKPVTRARSFTWVLRDPVSSRSRRVFNFTTLLGSTIGPSRGSCETQSAVALGEFSISPPS